MIMEIINKSMIWSYPLSLSLSHTHTHVIFSLAHSHIHLHTHTYAHARTPTLSLSVVSIIWKITIYRFFLISYTRTHAHTYVRTQNTAMCFVKPLRTKSGLLRGSRGQEKVLRQVGLPGRFIWRQSADSRRRSSGIIDVIQTMIRYERRQSVPDTSSGQLGPSPVRAHGIVARIHRVRVEITWHMRRVRICDESYVCQW